MAEDRTLAKESIFSTPFSIHKPKVNVPYYHLTQPVLGGSFAFEELQQEEEDEEVVIPKVEEEEAVVEEDEDEEEDSDEDEEDDDDEDDGIPRCLRNDPMFLYGGFGKFAPNQLPFGTLNAFPAFLSEDAEIPDCLRSIFVGAP